jgi:hypothetical protein
MCTYYIRAKKFLLTLSYPTYNILLFSRIGGAKIAHLNSSALVKLVPGSYIQSFIRNDAHSILMSQGGQGQVKCSKCGQSFNSQSELDNHNKNQHGA